jgi:hypothetical protein
MTLEEIEKDLPNGLHDAKLRSLTHNYDLGTLIIQVEVLTGLPEDPISVRSAYRDALISFSDVFLCQIEQPVNERIMGTRGSTSFQFWRTEPGTFPSKLSGCFPANALSYTLYVHEWESSIHVVAGDANFSWAHA